MTNKELKEILNQYPDDYQVFLDVSLARDIYISLKEPHIYVNEDLGQIELSEEVPEEDDLDPSLNLDNYEDIEI